MVGKEDEIESQESWRFSQLSAGWSGVKLSTSHRLFPVRKQELLPTSEDGGWEEEMI